MSQQASVFNQTLARVAVKTYDDAQDVRTSAMNRIRDLVRKRNEGIPLDAVEEEKEQRDFDSKYDDENLPDILEEMEEGDKLSDREFDYLDMMLKTAHTASKIEQQAQEIMEITETEPVYTEWLDNVYGVSTTLTARLIYMFGYCEDFEKVSNLWSYCGYDPTDDWEEGQPLTHNPEAKTLAWLVGDRIIMQGSNSQYKVEFYDPYKAEQLERMEASSCQFCGKPSHEHDPRGCEEFEAAMGEEEDFTLEYFELPDKYHDHATPLDNEPTPPWNRGHADNRARRYLSKKFLKHYWAIARDLQDLETPDEWVITHGGHEKRTDTFENPFYAKEQLR